MGGAKPPRRKRKARRWRVAVDVILRIDVLLGISVAATVPVVVEMLMSR